MKNFRIYFTLILTSVLCFSCIVDDEVENPTQNENLSRVIGFQDDVTLGNFVQETGAVFEFGVPVHLLGGSNGLPSNAEITTTYELGSIEDLGLSATDYASIFNLTKAQRIALENGDADLHDFVIAGEPGVHFDLVDTTYETTIPANSTFDLIDTNIYNDALNASVITYFVLHLRSVTSAGDVVIGEQLKSTVVKLQLCRTDLGGTYSVNYTTPRNHTVTSLGGGDYELDSMFGWPGSGYTSWFFACAGQLVFTEWVFSNEIIQGAPGYVNDMGQLVFPEFGIGRSSGAPIYSGSTWVLTPQ